jgi:predicted enzyme related to lactoylglutathione lyase
VEQRNNAVGWFEIPVINMERAIRFYETVFECKLERHQMGPLDMAWFPWVDSAAGAGGSLVCAPEFYTPEKNGTLVYFNAQSGDLANELGRVESVGGSILQKKTLIAEDVGFMAVVFDTEGNRIALHSRK